MSVMTNQELLEELCLYGLRCFNHGYKAALQRVSYYDNSGLAEMPEAVKKIEQLEKISKELMKLFCTRCKWGGVPSQCVIGIDRTFNCPKCLKRIKL